MLASSDSVMLQQRISVIVPLTNPTPDQPADAESGRAADREVEPAETRIARHLI